MQTERGPGFDRFVGRWEEAQHRAEFAKPGSAYLIGERAGMPNGFIILRDLDDPFGNVLLKRIAVTEPGLGFGQIFLRLGLGWVFAKPHVHRLWLDVMVHNERARQAYRAVGLTEDGILREAHAFADGTRVSLVLMAMLRSEWIAAQAALTPPPTGAA